MITFNNLQVGKLVIVVINVTGQGFVQHLAKVTGFGHKNNGRLETICEVVGPTNITYFDPDQKLVYSVTIDRLLPIVDNCIDMYINDSTISMIAFNEHGCKCEYVYNTYTINYQMKAILKEHELTNNVD